jgi:hypothetical protein
MLLWFTAYFGSRDSSVCIAKGRAAGVRFPAGAKDFSSVQSVQTDPGVYPAYCLCKWASGALSPGVNRPGVEADHSPPISAEIKIGGAIPLIRHVFMA